MQTDTSYTSQIFAHRGANKEAAENTRSAFDRALQYPIDGIETDIQLSRDGVPVLWHDWTMDKLGLPGKRIDDFDFSELAKINFSSFFSPDNDPEPVLSLQEFVDTYRERCNLQIEVKNHASDPPERYQEKMKLCIDIAGVPKNHEIFISSFHLKSLLYAHSYSPEFPLYFALNANQKLADVEFYLQKYSFLRGLCLPIELIDETIVRKLHEQNKNILVYTCNSKEEIIKALSMNINVVISDDPQQALQIRS